MTKPIDQRQPDDWESWEEFQLIISGELVGLKEDYKLDPLVLAKFGGLMKAFAAIYESCVRRGLIKPDQMYKFDNDQALDAANEFLKTYNKEL